MNAPRLKVLHVVRQYDPSTGGLETYVSELATRQSAHFDVAVLTLNRVFGSDERLPPLERKQGFPVFRIPFRGGRRLFFPYVPRKLLAAYDVIHIHAADQLLDVIAAMSLTRPAKMFMTTHGLFFHTRTLARVKAVYLRTITRWALGRMKAVFAVSGNDAATLRAVGVDTVLLRNPIVPLGDFIGEGRDLIYVGRISANKRVEALVEFMAALRETNPEVRLHLVGGDGEGLWNGLAERVKALGLEDRVIYHGFLETEALRDLARTCGYTVSASRYEGFGLSVIEGMSVGLLPLMHANEAFRETHALSGSGRLTDFDDPAQAARDFSAWAPTVTRDDREAAARFARAQTWDAVCAVYEQHYRAA